MERFRVTIDVFPPKNAEDNYTIECAAFYGEAKGGGAKNVRRSTTTLEAGRLEAELAKVIEYGLRDALTLLKEVE